MVQLGWRQLLPVCVFENVKSSSKLTGVVSDFLDHKSIIDFWNMDQKIGKEYWNTYQPAFVSALHEYCSIPKEDGLAIWATLYVRSFSWKLMHFFGDNEDSIDSEWWRNKMPVYIG